jgi:ribonuclease HI
MGHALAPAFMQRISTAVARHLHYKHQVSMVAYLDDWLIFGSQLPVHDILQTIQEIGLQINYTKSILQPTTTMTYLGLHISTHRLTITATQQCLQHLQDLVSVVPRASRQDLQRIAGYIAWLAYAMGWPQFLSTLIYQRSTYWPHVLHAKGFLRQPRKLQVPLLSRQLYTDATPTSAAAVFVGPPQQSIHQEFQDSRPIAFAEMAAALWGLLWCCQHCLTQPTTVTLHTDSSVVYHTIVKGGGLTLRSSALLQNLYIKLYMIMNKAGHGLVCRWVPSQQNLADPLTRGLHPRYYRVSQMLYKAGARVGGSVGFWGPEDTQPTTSGRSSYQSKSRL